jgi:integrase
LKWKDIDWCKGQIDIRRGWSKGKVPRSACSAGHDYLRPAAVKAGVIPEGYTGRFGWHNLRHSLATFFAANDVNLPVIQSILRHSKPSTTALYTHRVNAAQMAAQAKFLDAIKVTLAVA